MKKKILLEEKYGNRLSSKGLFIYAQSFYNYFSELLRADSDTTKFHPVQYYLASHSLELAMKSLLRKLGFTYDQLLMLGHDLEIIQQKVEQSNDIVFTELENKTIKSLNQYYSVKEFEYFLRGYKEFPDLLLTDMVTLEILSRIRGIVLSH